MRWGTPNCKSGFTHCSRGLWGQASSTIMLSLGWLSSSPSDCPLFRQQMVMMMVLTIIDGDVDNGVVDGAPVSLTIMFCSPACHPSVLCANKRRWVGYSEIGQNDYNIIAGHSFCHVNSNINIDLFSCIFSFEAVFRCFFLLHFSFNHSQIGPKSAWIGNLSIKCIKKPLQCLFWSF